MTRKIPEIHDNTVVSPIASDKELEKTINLGEYKYYIGLPAEKGLGTPRVPYRTAPYEEDLDLGWSDTDYSIEKLKVSVITPVDVVEIVESETGTWAGFLYDGEILYTDVGNIRIKDGETCPLISKKTVHLPLLLTSLLAKYRKMRFFPLSISIVYSLSCWGP